MAARRHFSPALFDFLRELAANNDRQWFQANRDRYEGDVRGPLLQFIADVAGPLARISRHFIADPRPQGGSMFRIHRDVRFSRDKSPYKTAASAHFRHALGKDVHCPGFYLHLEPDQCFVGAGIWHPDSRTLGRIREALTDDPRAWKRAIGGKAFRELCTLSGEVLSRPPRGFGPDHPLIEDIKRKDFVSHAVHTEEQACAAGFLDRFVTVCRANAPFVKFLTEAAGAPF